MDRSLGKFMRYKHRLQGLLHTLAKQGQYKQMIVIDVSLVEGIPSINPSLN